MVLSKQFTCRVGVRKSIFRRFLLTYRLHWCCAPAHCCRVRGEEGECTSRGLYEGEFFPGIGKIQYRGPDSKNALSFHYYNADEVIMGKPMKEW